MKFSNIESPDQNTKFDYTLSVNSPTTYFHIKNTDKTDYKCPNAVCSSGLTDMGMF